jgi:hypothetical protein
MRKAIHVSLLLGLFLQICIAPVPAQEPRVIKLPEPQTDGGRPLMQALKARQTSREFGAVTKLPMQILANLLWAADGLNRRDGKPTAPSARGEIRRR